MLLVVQWKRLAQEEIGGYEYMFAARAVTRYDVLELSHL
jgi:hypothetical protein